MHEFNNDLNRKANILQNEIVGYVKSKVLFIAAKNNLHHHLSEIPTSINALSQKMGFNPQATLRLLRLLESLELVEIRDKDTILATKYTVQLEKLSSEHYFRGYLAFEEFNHTLTHNQECWSQKFGESFYDYLRNNPEIVSNLADYCAITGKDWLPSVLELSDLSIFPKIMDIGGANGYFLSLILEKYPTISGIVFDLPNMIAEANHFIPTLSPDIQKRISLISGSFFEHIQGYADAYLLCRVFLNWNNTDALRILNTVSEAMSPNARLIIIDFVIPEKSHPHYQRALLHDLNLFGILGSSIRNFKEWEELLDNAKFKIEEFNITGTDIPHEPNVPFGMIIAKKA